MNVKTKMGNSVKVGGGGRCVILPFGKQKVYLRGLYFWETLHLIKLRKNLVISDKPYNYYLAPQMAQQ